MENRPRYVAQHPYSGSPLESSMNRQTYAFPNIGGQANRRRSSLQQRIVENDIRKLREVKREEPTGLTSISYADVVRRPLNWIPLFADTSIQDANTEEARLNGPAEQRSQVNGPPPFGHFGPFDQFKNWVSHFKVQTKDQCVQTDPYSDPCPTCLRNDVRHHPYGAVFGFNPNRPNIPDASRINAYSRDNAIEAPDRAYYGHQQLTFFRGGNLIYNGWTFMTLDGRIEHMPSVSREIPTDELNNDRPHRGPAPL